jgi:crossover junction endodeoxyribonuclease RusA
VNVIELPWPPRILSPNGRGHYMDVYRAKKKAKEYAFAVTRAAKIGIAAGDVPILISLRFHPPTKNAPDADNAVASMKAALDGIALALKVDDSAFRLAAPIIAGPVKGGKVIITVGEGDPEVFHRSGARLSGGA